VKNPIVELYAGMYLRQRKVWGSLASPGVNTILALTVPLTFNIATLLVLGSWLLGSEWLFDNLKAISIVAGVTTLVAMWFCVHQSCAGANSARRLRSKGHAAVRRRLGIVVAYFAVSLLVFFATIFSLVPRLSPS